MTKGNGFRSALLNKSFLYAVEVGGVLTDNESVPVLGGCA